MNKLICGISDSVVSPKVYIPHIQPCLIGFLVPTPLVVMHVLILSAVMEIFPPQSSLGLVPYLRYQIVILHPLCFVIYKYSSSIMTPLNPILWCVLHTQLMAGVNIWNFKRSQETSMFLLYPLISRVLLF